MILRRFEPPFYRITLVDPLLSPPIDRPWNWETGSAKGTFYPSRDEAIEAAWAHKNSKPIHFKGCHG